MVSPDPAGPGRNQKTCLKDILVVVVVFELVVVVVVVVVRILGDDYDYDYDNDNDNGSDIEISLAGCSRFPRQVANRVVRRFACYASVRIQ